MNKWKQDALEAVKEEMEVLIQERCSVIYGKLMRKVCVFRSRVLRQLMVELGIRMAAPRTEEN